MSEYSSVIRSLFLALAAISELNVLFTSGKLFLSVNKTNYTTAYGTPVTLECTVTWDHGFDLVHVYWTKVIDGFLTQMNVGYPGTDGMTMGDPSLTILFPSFDDSGQYICAAKDFVSNCTSEPMHLSVIGGIPNVTIDTRTHTVEYEQNITLECNIISIPTQRKVYWQKRVNHTVTNITTENPDGVISMESSLTIVKAEMSDSGEYICYAENLLGTGKSNLTNVIVVGDIPNVQVGPTIASVEYGCAVTLKCNITSFPVHTTVYWQWTFKGRTTYITRGSTGIDGVKILSPSLTISKAESNDSGLYTCYAINKIGTGHSDTVNLTVIGDIPIVTADSSSSDISYGHNHTINCKVVSVPVLRKVYWHKIFNDTITLITSNTSGISGVRNTRPSLTILNAIPSDSGQYVCYGVNIVGTGHSNFINLTVIGEENYPIVGIESNRYMIKYNDLLTIISKVQKNVNFPIRKIYWQYENNGVLTQIEAGTNGIAGSTIEVPSLTIKTVTTSESGLYTCFATNDIGTGHSELINVTVVGGLSTVSVEKKTYISMYSHQVTLKAFIKADPPVKFVYWEKVVNGTRTIINNGGVGIQGVTPNNPSLVLKYTTKADNGIYRCFSTNDVGTSSSDEVQLQVTGEKPDVFVPFAKVLVNFGDKAKLECKANSSQPVTIVYWERIINGIISRIQHGTYGTVGSNVDDPSLTILYATNADSGLYTCLVGNVVGIGFSKTMNFSVTGGMPAVSVGSPFYNTTYGKQITLECKIKAYPPVTLVYWQNTKRGIIITINEGTIGTQGINATMPSLVLMFPTTTDIGNYTCFATNKAGTQKSMTTTLNVEGDLPFVTVRSHMYTGNYGDTVTLECDINANPPAKRCFWYKTVNGITKEISNGFEGTLGSSPMTPSLTILFATSADTARYTCAAQNIVGIGKSQSTFLHVLADIPEVTVPFDSYKTGIGYSITLVCRISDTIPRVSRVYWQRYTKNATTVITSDTIGIYGVTVDSPSLTISSAKESMSGEYSCFAINSVGTGKSLPSSLIVEAGVIPSANTDDNDKESISAAVIGTVTALAMVASVVIAYMTYRKTRKGGETAAPGEETAAKGIKDNGADTYKKEEESKLHPPVENALICKTEDVSLQGLKDDNSTGDGLKNRRHEMYPASLSIGGSENQNNEDDQRESHS